MLLALQAKQSISHLLRSLFCLVIFFFSLLFSDLGLDQFIVKRYDGKVRTRCLLGKVTLDSSQQEVLIFMLLTHHY